MLTCAKVAQGDMSAWVVSTTQGRPFSWGSNSASVCRAACREASPPAPSSTNSTPCASPKYSGQKGRTEPAHQSHSITAVNTPKSPQWPVSAGPEWRGAERTSELLDVEHGVVDGQRLDVESRGGLEGVPGLPDQGGQGGGLACTAQPQAQHLVLVSGLARGTSTATPARQPLAALQGQGWGNYATLPLEHRTALGLRKGAKVRAILTLMPLQHKS